MEMETEEECSQRFEISESVAVKNARTNNTKNKVYATLGVENDRQADEVCSGKFSCNLPEFGDFQELDNSFYRYVCSICKVPKPNARLLDIHVQEVHDSFFKMLAERQPMYECYVSDCDLKFNSPFERGEHCVSDHNYPKNSRFENGKHITGLERIRGKLTDYPILIDKSPKSEKRKNSEEGYLENLKKKTFYGNLNNSCSSTQLDISKSALIFIPTKVTQNKSLTPQILHESTSMM